MHLTQLEVEAYIAGIRPATVERHVRLCCSCAMRLGGASAAAGRWERRGILGRLVRVEEPASLERELDTMFSDHRDAA